LIRLLLSSKDEAALGRRGGRREEKEIQLEMKVISEVKTGRK